MDFQGLNSDLSACAVAKELWLASLVGSGGGFTWLLPLLDFKKKITIFKHFSFEDRAGLVQKAWQTPEEEIVSATTAGPGSQAHTPRPSPQPLFSTSSLSLSCPLGGFQ